MAGDILDEFMAANGIKPEGERHSHTFRRDSCPTARSACSQSPDACHAQYFTVANFRRPEMTAEGPVTFVVETDADGRLLSVSAEDGFFVGYQARRLRWSPAAAWRWLTERVRRVLRLSWRWLNFPIGFLWDVIAVKWFAWRLRRAGGGTFFERMELFNAEVGNAFDQASWEIARGATVERDAHGKLEREARVPTGEPVCPACRQSAIGLSCGDPAHLTARGWPPPVT